MEKSEWKSIEHYEAKEILARIINDLEYQIDDLENKLRIAKVKRDKLKTFL